MERKQKTRPGADWCPEPGGRETLETWASGGQTEKKQTRQEKKDGQTENDRQRMQETEVNGPRGRGRQGQKEQ